MGIYLWFSGILLAGYLGLMLWYTCGLHAAFRKALAKSSAPEKNHRFTIVIAMRDEAENIGACLASILGNDYHNYEIILVDDFSNDESVDIAATFLKPPHQILKLSDFYSAEERLNSFKKLALDLGIRHASGDYIITTDADCEVGAQWLVTINKKLNENEEVVCLSAPVNFIPVKKEKSILYYFQSIDFLTMQGITIASNELGLGNMSNGANFVFSLAAFNEVGAYKGIDQKASGDDMMLMQKIQAKYPNGIDVLVDKLSIVDTAVQGTWSGFLNQRIRWASKADSYPQKRLSMVLALVYFFNVNLFFLLVSGIFWPACWDFLGLSLALKVLVECIFVIPLSKYFKKENELLFLIILQPLHILYIISAGFLGKFGKYTWKGRQVQ